MSLKAKFHGSSNILVTCYKDASDFSVQVFTANKFVLKITVEILQHASSLSSLPVLEIPRAQHARLVADMSASDTPTILTCRDGLKLKVANILVASSQHVSDFLEH